LIVAAWNVSAVPGPTVPVLVKLRGVLDGIGMLHQPVINGEAKARTSLGVSAKSKAEGMAVPVPERRLRMVWWRASTVKIDPAAARSTGSVKRVAPPRYAATPTFSTTRAVAAMAATSVKAESKLNWQPVIGVPPNEAIAASSVDECVVSSEAMACICSITSWLDEKPAEVKSESLNLARAWW